MLHFSKLAFAAEPAFLGSSKARIVAWTLGLLVVLGTAWGASAISESMRRKERARRKKAAANTKDVFEEICLAQELSVAEKRQLLGGAAILNLHSPALLFIDSSLLSKLAKSDCDDSAAFRKLSDRLFPANARPSKSDLTELTETPVAV